MSMLWNSFPNSLLLPNAWGWGSSYLTRFGAAHGVFPNCWEAGLNLLKKHAPSNSGVQILSLAQRCNKAQNKSSLLGM